MEVLDRLDEQARSLLEVIAVVAGRVARGELVRYAYLPEGQLVDPLGTLVREGLLTEIEPGRNPIYELADPLLGDLVRDRLDEGRLVVLHRHVGRTLLVSGRLDEAAPHFARSATPDDTEAMVVLSEAQWVELAELTR